jgi:hypothetical protein
LLLQQQRLASFSVVKPTRTRRSTDTTIRGANIAMPDTDASDFTSYSATMFANTTCELTYFEHHDSRLRKVNMNKLDVEVQIQ